MINVYDFEVFMYDWMVVIVNPETREENVIINELNIDIKHGDVNIDNSIFNETSSNLKMGNFNFDGKINESIYINNNIGDITLMVNDNIENYKVNTTNIIGSVLINGKNNENVNNGDKMISVKNKIGSISVNF